MLKLGADYIEYGIHETDGTKGLVGGMRINCCGEIFITMNIIIFNINLQF
jgi:hypothetical protein